MSKEDCNDWDPLDPAILKEQRGAYDEMREHCPVAHSEFMNWSVFRHSDISKILADPKTFSSVSSFLAIPNGMDPPVHGRYREALAGRFSQEEMAKLEPRTRQIARELLEQVLTGEEAELAGSFVTPFALRTLCALLGWPEEQWECLAGWTHGNQHAALHRDAAEGKELAMLFDRHVKANLDEHRTARHSSDNATAALLQTQVDGKPLDDEQIVSVLRNWTAGQGTVAAGLGILLLHLSEDPELQQRLRRDPSLIPAAIEEILRVDGPLVANRRTASKNVELQGRPIGKGESLSLMWIAANRDPRAFTDADTADIDRNTEDSLVWGKGIHVCMGAPLARLEMRVALEELLARTEQFALADTQPERDLFPSNGIGRIHLRFSCVPAVSNPER